MRLKASGRSSACRPRRATATSIRNPASRRDSRNWQRSTLKLGAGIDNVTLGGSLNRIGGAVFIDGGGTDQLMIKSDFQADMTLNRSDEAAIV